MVGKYVIKELGWVMVLVLVLDPEDPASSSSSTMQRGDLGPVSLSLSLSLLA